MGKKKSVVLMILLTIVIAVLCAITVFPSFSIPGTVKIWNPAVTQYDFGADLDGGYYAYYYPEGVITATEYQENLDSKTGEDYDEYAASYKQYKDTSLYLSTDEDDGIFEDGAISAEFTTEFNKLVKEVSARYAAKNYSDYRVSVVDDYAILVELPASEIYASTVMASFAYTGALTLQVSGEVIDGLDDKDVDMKDYIKEFSVDTQYEVAYLKVKLTNKGEDLINSVKSTLSSSSAASTSTDGSATSITIMVGDNQVGYGIFSDYIDGKTIMIPEAGEESVAAVETYAILLNSALENGEFGISFSAFDANEIKTYAPVYGDNVVTLLYIALGVILLASIVLPIVRRGRFGVANAYVILSYLIVTGLCFAFITEKVFEITLGSVLVFLLGLILVGLLNDRFYKAIKAEFSLGKTVESSFKTGYKKTLFGAIDIYALLVLGSIAFLIGVGGLYTMAVQALICFVTGAFCNLLWTYAINFVFLSASKNKFKYFRFVREDDDDE